MKRSRKRARLLRRPFSAAERARRWRKRHPAKHRAQQRRAYQRKRERQRLAALERLRIQEREQQAEIRRQNAELQRKQQADAGGFTEQEAEALKTAFAGRPELLRLHFPGEALDDSALESTAPPIPTVPVSDPAKEQEQLLQNKLRLDRLRAETQEQNEANRLRDAAVSRSRF